MEFTDPGWNGGRQHRQVAFEIVAREEGGVRIEPSLGCSWGAEGGLSVFVEG